MVFEHVGGIDAALSRIESTPLAIGLRGASYPERAKASFMARGYNEQLLRMFVDAE